MALQFNPNIRYVVLNRGILQGLSSAITVFGGTQPTAANLITNWNTIKVGAILHHTGCAWTHPIGNTTTFISLTTLGSAASAIITDVGTWAVLWSSAVTQGQLSNTTIPNTSFMIVPVSLTSGQGVIRYNPTVNFVAASSYSIADGNITVGTY